MEIRDPRKSPAYNLWLANNAWQRTLRSVLEPFDITHVQYIVLASIDLLRADGTSVCQAEVCRFCDMDENMVSQVLKALEAEGRITRTRNEDDKRARQPEVTEKGHALLNDVRKVLYPAIDQFFSVLAVDKADFTLMLQKLSSAGPD